MVLHSVTRSGRRANEGLQATAAMEAFRVISHLQGLAAAPEPAR